MSSSSSNNAADFGALQRVIDCGRGRSLSVRPRTGHGCVLSGCIVPRDGVRTSGLKHHARFLSVSVFVSVLLVILDHPLRGRPA